jgi:hypothetical protein
MSGSSGPPNVVRRQRGGSNLPTRRVAAWAAGLTGAVFGVSGFLLITFGGQGAAGFGYVAFLVLPVAAGFALGIVTHPRATIWTAVVFCVMWAVPFLIVGKWEGILCCLMAAPIVLPGIVIGALVGHVMRRRYTQLPTAVILLAAALPVLGAARAEHDARPAPPILRVSSSIVLPTKPEVAWTLLIAVDAIRVPKPLLMYVGLPVPRFCRLEGSGVGARRVCHFDQGTIEERITAWEPGKLLAMDIVRSTLPGRHWLEFADARYDLTQVENGTRVERTTAIRSFLLPRWYWAPLEAWGVESEHAYLLAELERQSGE